MRFRSLWPSDREARQDAMQLLVEPPRYKQWAYAAGRELGAYAPPALTQDEAKLANRWAQVQKEAWGWHLDVRQGPSGEDCLLAFSGAEDADVEWLIYRVGIGFQSDEWTGKSRWSATLEHALSALAPVPGPSSLVSC